MCRLSFSFFKRITNLISAVVVDFKSEVLPLQLFPMNTLTLDDQSCVGAKDRLRSWNCQYF